MVVKGSKGRRGKREEGGEQEEEGNDINNNV